MAGGSVIRGSGGAPSTALAVPTSVQDTTFGPDGTLYFTTSAMNPFSGGELMRWRPGTAAAERLHAWGAAPNGALRSPGAVTYLSGHLYVEAAAANVFSSCQDKLYKLDPDGRVVREAPGLSCGGLWDAGGGRVSALDYESRAVRYFDPVTLEPAGESQIGGPHILAAGGAPDGTWVFASGETRACGDIRVKRLGPSGAEYDAALTAILGLDAADACGFGGAVATTTGDIVVLAADVHGLIAATVKGATVTRTRVGPETAVDLALIADGAGNAVISFAEPRPCTDPQSPATIYECTRMHLLKLRAGAATPIATEGGTWGESVRIQSLNLSQGSVTGSVSTAPYYCGTNCTPWGTTRAQRFFGADVARQAWHDPA